jgi:hypothetical protein
VHFFVLRANKTYFCSVGTIDIFKLDERVFSVGVE